MNLIKRNLKALFLALCFVAPLYCVWGFEILFFTDPPLWINTILGIVSVWVFLSVKKDIALPFGFFTGLLWFYWIGFSFEFFGFSYLIPVISVVVACIYMVIFFLALWCENLWYRGVALGMLSFMHPFGFDWMIVDSFFAYSYFGVQKYDFFLVVLGVIFLKLSLKEKRWLIVAIASMVGAISFGDLNQPKEKLPFRVDLFESHYPQDFKWQRENAQKITDEMIKKIEDSIARGNGLIVLPETAFPFVLEHTPYFTHMKTLSQKAILVIGSLREGAQGVYNSIYIFKEGRVEVVDKVVLAPFGEQIPLPRWISRHLEKMFFGEGGMRMLAGEKFGVFEYEKYFIRPVVCYEGTSPKAYEYAPKYMIVLSNNAWFGKSIQSSLQKNLMKYYARKNKKIILHSSNGSRSFVVFP